MKTRQLIEISMFVALALVLDFAASFYSRWIWLQGGSISLSLVPLAILAYRQGLKTGLLGGAFMGILQLLLGAYIYHPIQVLFDYPFAFAALGLTGLWAKPVNERENTTLLIVISTFVASSFRFLFHVISGYVFFGVYAPEGVNPMWHSVFYNVGYVFLSWLASAIVLVILYRNQKNLLRN